MLLLVLLPLLLLPFLDTTHAYAADQLCSGYPSWVRGTAYNQMSISSYSTSTTRCLLALSPSANVYDPGQVFTVTVSSPSYYGYKAITTGGAVIGIQQSGGVLAASDCVNFRSKYLSRTFTITAPSQGGEIRVKALCGTNQVGMYVANDLVLQPSVSVAPPAGTPSTDPAYQYQTALGSGFTLFFRKNATHVNFKAQLTRSGYVSFGVGSSMVPAVVMVGMDPASNPGYSAVGLYQLNGKTGSNSAIAQLLAGPSTLSLYNIVGASFSSVGGVSTLQYSVLTTGQHAQFTIDSPGGVDIAYAAGSSSGFGVHSIAGVLTTMDFSTGVNSGSGSGTGGGGTTSPPIPGSSSNDVAYDWVKPLTASINLYYKLNATHLKFRLSRTTSSGYLAFGSTNLMIGSTAIVGMDDAVNSGYPRVGVYNIVSKSGSNSQIMTATATTPSTMYATFGIFDTAFLTTASTSDLYFTIELAKQSPSFTMAPPSGASVNAIYAAGPPAYGMHTYAGSLNQVSFAGGINGGLEFFVSGTMMAHIAAMIVAWELLVPFGITTALFGKRGFVFPKNWLRNHWVFEALGVVFGFGGTAAAYLYMENRETKHWNSRHQKLGLAVLLLSIAQPLYGRFRPRGGAQPLARKVFVVLHPLIGYGLFALGLAATLTGVQDLEALTGGNPWTYSGFTDQVGFSSVLGMLVLGLAIVTSLLIVIGLALTPRSSSTGAASEDSDLIAYTCEQVLGHAHEADCWVIYKGKVYDVTKWIGPHPGGKKNILSVAGTDMTKSFESIGHSKFAQYMLKDYLIGKVVGDMESGSKPALAAPPNNPAPASNVFLNGDKPRKFVTLAQKTPISPNALMLRFNLPRPDMILGLPIGKHITMFAKTLDGQEIQRKYTPVSCDEEDHGYFVLVVKVYKPTAKFPQGGRMGQVLHRLKVGGKIEIGGSPVGRHEYLGGGEFVYNDVAVTPEHVVLIAGGSGITPIYQIASALLRDRTCRTTMSIIYANSTVDDVLLRGQLGELEVRYYNRIRVWFTVSQTPRSKWKYSVGRVSQELFAQHLFGPRNEPVDPATCLAITCGPQPLVDTVSELLMMKFGFARDHIYEY